MSPSFPPSRIGPAVAQGSQGESGLVRKAIRHAKQGNAEALHFLYVRYAAEVLDCLRGKIRGGREAEDLVQKVFSELGTLIGDYEPGDEPFLVWLAEAALHQREAASRASPSPR